MMVWHMEVYIDYSINIQDVQYGDIDYMEDYKDFTIDPVDFADLPQYVDQLKLEGTSFVIILVNGSNII